MSNIVLIGFMGCGKTSVGMRLAKKLGYDFLDTDKLIVDEYESSVADIFEQQGEEYFRGLETKTIKRLCNTVDNSVISVGGGLPITNGNGDILRMLGTVVFLNVSKDTIMKRLSGDTKRPLLAGDNLSEKIESLLVYRQPFYESIAQITITVDNKEFDTILDEIGKRLDLTI